MSGLELKILAVLTMVIDHAGIVLFAGTPWYEICRMIGRLSFPLYAFLLSEGYVHTKSVRKYAGRLLLFALLSELPFDRAIYGTWFYPQSQNVFFTLFLGLLLLDRLHGCRGQGRAWWMLLFLLLAETFSVDYGAFGVLAVVLFYQIRGKSRWNLLFMALLFAGYGFLGGFPIEAAAGLSMLLIACYNGKKGQYPVPSLVFYGIYPLHLLLLAAVCRYIPY